MRMRLGNKCVAMYKKSNFDLILFDSNFFACFFCFPRMFFIVDLTNGNTYRLEGCHSNGSVFITFFPNVFDNNSALILCMLNDAI